MKIQKHTTILSVWIILALILLPAPLQVTAQPMAAAWQAIGQVGGLTSAVAIQGNMAYVGVGLRLVALNISDPANPIEVGATPPFPTFVEGIAVSGSRAYVADGSAGLGVVDITHPAKPAILGIWDSPGYAEGVAVAGSTAYLADGPYGLRVLDVSNPARPTPIAAAYDMAYAFQVAISGNTLYIAAGGYGLLVADITDPAHPVEIGGMDTPGYAYDVAIAGSRAYIADAWGGLLLASLANPAAPSLLGRTDTLGWALSVTVSGSAVFVADGGEGLQVFDATDPAHPRQLGVYRPTGTNLARRLAAAGNMVFIADYDQGLEIVDASDPTALARIGGYSLLADARQIAVSGNYVYVAAGFDGLRVVDISNPAHPRVVGQAAIDGGFADSVAASGGYVYLSTFMTVPYDLYVFDVSDPTHPKRTGTIFTGGTFREIALQGQIVYAADENGIRLIDVSNPYAPVQLSAIALQTSSPQGATSGVAVSGTKAYASGGANGIWIVDVSNPSSPQIAGRYAVLGGASLAAAGNRIYVADGSSGLQIADVSNPAQPVVEGRYDTPGYALRVTLAGMTAAVSDAGGGLQVVDIADPLNPTLLSAFDTPGLASDAVVVGNMAYIADAYGGLVILQQTTVQGGANPALSAPGIEQQPAGWDLLAGEAPFSLPQDDNSLALPQRPDAVKLPPLAETPPEILSKASSPSQPGNPAAQAPARPAVTCVVASTADHGPGTLRECLQNASAGDHITFDPAVFPPASPAAIHVETQLPSIEQAGITIDASTAGVILDGSGAEAGAIGLILHSDGNTIKGLQVINFPASGIAVNSAHNHIGGSRAVGSGPLGEGNRFSGNHDSGVSIAGDSAAYNIVTGNFIGTDITGSVMAGNGSGLGLGPGANHNVIGSLVEAERNVISGNATEVFAIGQGCDYNIVTGNLIGTDPSGSYPLRTSTTGNVIGIHVFNGASHNTFGPGNVIGGVDYGLNFEGDGVDENSITGNFIGIGRDGITPLRNWIHGILLNLGPQHNRIGGLAPGEGNVISDNGNGVVINGATTLYNTISANAIYANIAKGIMNTNGGNAELPAPTLTSVTTTTVAGTAPANATLEVFSDRGEQGRVFEGQTNATALGSFTFTRPGGLTGPHITAVATDLAGNTSEFSLPALLTVFTHIVTSPLDSGPGTLREALQDAQWGDAITFDPAVFPPHAPVTIHLSSNLPDILHGGITIDGSHAGVILDGSQIAGSAIGLQVNTDDNTIQGLQFIHFQFGISMYGSDNRIGGDRAQGEGPTGQGNLFSADNHGLIIGGNRNVLAGNLIGTDATGKAAMGNFVGIRLSGQHNLVGGSAPGEHNVISANTMGLQLLGIDVKYNTIAGNMIGTDIDGEYALGNVFGIRIEVMASDNTVGGDTPGERNLISGNQEQGVVISDSGTQHNTVIGNFIGTNADGTAAIPNRLGVAVFAAFNRVGGTAPGEGNLISGNDGGISLATYGFSDNFILGNWIGTDASGTRALGNGGGIGFSVSTGHTFIGGPSSGERNVISGNDWGVYGTFAGTENNWVMGNFIGLDASGTQPLGNTDRGVWLSDYAAHCIIQGNRIAYSGMGVVMDHAQSVTLRRNAIFDNTTAGIALLQGGNGLLPAPTLGAARLTGISGTACPGCTVEIYSDAGNEGRVYEGSTIASKSGIFRFSKSTRLAGPWLTATATDLNGNTSAFSLPWPAWKSLYLPTVHR